MQQDLFSPPALTFDLPDADLYYYGDFIDNQWLIYQQLVDQLAWQQDTINMYGKVLKIPRLNCWYGDKGAQYSYSGIALKPQAWIPLLTQLKTKIERFLIDKVFIDKPLQYQSFNSVLGNYYRDERDSVAWHSDDEKELGFDPIIASLSFGQSRRFSLKHKYDPTINPMHMDLEGGSLLVMAGKMQSHWQHQLPKLNRACDGRVNLTFRQVIATDRVSDNKQSTIRGIDGA